jgi:predicted ester cyclase
MTTARNLLESLADAYNRHDLDGVAALYAPDATINDGDLDAAVAAHASWFAVIPDVKAEIRTVAADGAVVIAEISLNGTNTGPVPLGDVDRALLGTNAEALPPTGRTVAVPVVVVIEVADGRIATERDHLNPLALLEQLALFGAS